MAGYFGPLARAIESFEPWQGQTPAPDTDFSELERYWNDPAYKQEVDERVARRRAEWNAAIDRALEPQRARQAARWAAEEAEGRA